MTRFNRFPVTTLEFEMVPTPQKVLFVDAETSFDAKKLDPIKTGVADPYGIARDIRKIQKYFGREVQLCFFVQTNLKKEADCVKEFDAKAQTLQNYFGKNIEVLSHAPGLNINKAFLNILKRKETFPDYAAYVTDKIESDLVVRTLKASDYKI